MPTGRVVAGGSIQFDESACVGLDPSPLIRIGRESREVTRVGIVDFQDIDSLILECFPAPPALPGQHPNVSYLYVNTLDFEPWPPQPEQSDVSYSNGAAVYDWAKCKVTYSTLPYDASDLVSRHTTFSVEAIPLPDTGLKWADTGQPVKVADIQANKYVPIVEHVITLHRANASNTSTVRTEVGKVNNALFEGATSETLMFTGANETFTIGTTGAATYTRAYHFKERRVQHGGNIYGWNHFWRTETGAVGWAKITDSSGNPLFPLSANFSSLY